MQRIVHNKKKIKSLTSKHAFYDSLLQKEIGRVSSDDLKVLDLKKKKLQIRDEIVKLSK